VFGAHLRRDAEGRIEHWDVVRPTAHHFYTTRMLDVEDGLGKWEGVEGVSKFLPRTIISKKVTG
jgi:hypothetical protein